MVAVRTPAYPLSLIYGKERVQTGVRIDGKTRLDHFCCARNHPTSLDLSMATSDVQLLRLNSAPCFFLANECLINIFNIMFNIF